MDVADVAAALFADTSVNGIVEIGQLPAVTGDQLAKSFATHLGREVKYSSLTPEEFGTRFLTVLFGEAAAAEVVEIYKAKALSKDSAIAANISAQHLFN